MNLLGKILKFIINVVYYVLLCMIGIAIALCLAMIPVNYFEIQDLKKQNQEIYYSMADYYDEVMQVQALNNLMILGINEGMDKAKAEALKRDNTLFTLITGLEKKTSNQITEIKERPTYEYLKSITVLIAKKVPDEDRGWLGTGVIIKETEDSTYIVTNNHVCDDTETYQCFVSENGAKYPIERVKINTVGYDVQVIKISGHIPNKRPVKGLGSVKHQDSVYMVGHHLGRAYFYAEGTVAGFDANRNMALITAMPSGPGNSGSGIIDSEGNLVGLLYAGDVVSHSFYQTLALTHGICVDSKVLKLFLKDYISEVK